MIVQFRRWLLNSPIRDRDQAVEIKKRGLEKLGAAVKDLSAEAHALALETLHHVPIAHARTAQRSK